MKQRTTARVGLLIIIALILVGISYGSWIDELTAAGSVTTGTLDVGYVDDIAANITHEGSVAEATCQVELLGDGQPSSELADAPEDIDTGDDLLFINIQNASPGFRCEIHFTIQNYGSVPVTLALEPTDSEMDAIVESITCGDDSFTAMDLYQNESTDCELVIALEEDSTLEPGTYLFGYLIKASQWNEASLSQ